MPVRRLGTHRFRVALGIALLGVTASAIVSAQTTPAPAGAAVWSNFDFVPGERVLFAEDFSKDRVGNFPQRLELVNGNMEVVEWKGSRWLRVINSGESASFIVPLPEQLPQRFTMEFDMTIPWNGVAIYSADKADGLGPLSPQRSNASVSLAGTLAGVVRGSSDQGSTVDPRTLFTDFFAEEGDVQSRIFKVRIEVDGKYAKAYLDEQRIANIPNADFGRANKIIFDYSTTDNDKNLPVLIGNISINAGGKKLYDALAGSGRVATQGVYFDVGSDRIRGESTPTLREIGDMLTEHPELALMVEGHTDNTGSAIANQALSQKRAQAIVDYLTSTFKIASARLKASGLGASKPAASNATAEGRQSNRRVELVRM